MENNGRWYEKGWVKFLIIFGIIIPIIMTVIKYFTSGFD
jgi:hypothetical protein